MLLAGDIGGTKTDLAVFSSHPEQDLFSPLVQKRFPSAEYPSLEAIVQQFLKETGLSVDYACFGVAGPVINGSAQLTNLPWVLQENILSQRLNLKAVRLVNDLLTIAKAIPELPPNSYYTLNTGQPVKGTIAVVAPGTGLGEAFLTLSGSQYYPFPSEGGHASFAPVNLAQIELVQYLWKQFTHVSYERVCSGNGIQNIYRFFKDSNYAAESQELASQLSQAIEPTRLIINAALDQNEDNELCKLTIDTFVSILGAEAGNFALKVMAQGGVYLAGGIPKSILPYLKSSTFMEAFINKGRFNNFLSQIPVHVVLQRVELLGAALFAREFL